VGSRRVHGFAISAGTERVVTPVRVQPRRRRKVRAVAEVVADTSEGPSFELLHGQRRVDLPEELVALLLTVARAAACGENVAVVVGEAKVPEELTSQQVADLLNVSRPYVVKLARSGVLPHRMVGNRHRFNAGDVLVYKEAEERRREGILAGLAPTSGYTPGDF
jgi:excisionase family DNA binding protein